MVFTQTELDYLASQRLGRLATVQPNRTLQVSPVGFSYNPSTATIDIHGYNLDKSRKFRNIADNGHAAFVVDDLVTVQPWRVRCLEIRGVAYDAKNKRVFAAEHDPSGTKNALRIVPVN